MISFPRAAARAVLAVARHAVVGRLRGPAPPVTLSPADGAVIFSVVLPQLVVQLRVPTDRVGDATIVLPMEALEAVEGTGTDPVTVETKGRRAVLRWTDRGQPRSKEVEAGPRRPMRDEPVEPTTFAAMPPEFVVALHEAGRCAGRPTGRYALDRVQLKGRTGDVVASDGASAYLHGGFAFSFAEDLLVPATAVFGAADLRGEPVGLGRSTTHLAVRIGPWTVSLPLDDGGRFPDVAAVVPKAAPGKLLRIDDADAEELRAALPKLPGAGEEHRPVTLDTGNGRVPVVRARAAGSGDVVEVRLDRSTTPKGMAAVALDRAFLDRALRLGCRTFHVAAADKPVAARCGRLTLVAVPLDGSMIVAGTLQAIVRRTATPPVPTVDREATPSASTALVPLIPASTEAMVLTEPGELLTEIAPSETVDPLAEAEALRDACVDAGHRVARLLAWFKARRREPKAIAKVWSSLQSLKLRPGGPQ